MKMPPNKKLMQAMQDLRRSSASSKHRNKKKYNRKTENWRKDF